MQYDGFVLDAHSHVMEGAFGAKRLLQIEEGYGYHSCNALGAVAWGGAAQNVQCLAVKLFRPDCYAFAGLNHCEGDFEFQCRRLAGMGADGFKLIEGKPDVYRKIGKTLDDPYYDDFYRFAQENGFPILAHVGDPPEFWDIAKAPAFAVKNGWTYTDGCYPELDELFAQVENVVTRFPELHLVLAHFFFHSHQLDRAAAFLDRHPCVSFDLCPGTEMYDNFSQAPAAVRTFFLKYQDRLVFGTDNWDTDDPQEKKDKDEINRMIHNFLQTGKAFSVWDRKMCGLDLPVSVLKKIYEKNFRRLAGKEPRALNKTALAEHCRELIDEPERFGTVQEDKIRLQTVLDTLSA